MSKLKYEILQEQYPDTLVLELQGNFYKAYDSSAWVLSGLMEYKLKETKAGYKCGFPVVAYDKVKAVCENNRINYVFYDGEKLSDQDVFPDNQFDEYRRLYKPVQKVQSSPVEVTAKKERQALLLIEGCGMNVSDALVDLKHNVEKQVLEKGFRIISLSVFEKEVNSKVVFMQGLAVYE